MKAMLEQVEAKADSHGHLHPQAFHYEGKRVRIVSYGRQWTEGGIHHYLVMDHRRQVYQIGYHRADNRWLIIQPPGAFGPPGKPAV